METSNDLAERWGRAEKPPDPPWLLPPSSYAKTESSDSLESRHSSQLGETSSANIQLEWDNHSTRSHQRHAEFMGQFNAQMETFRQSFTARLTAIFAESDRRFAQTLHNIQTNPFSKVTVEPEASDSLTLLYVSLTGSLGDLSDERWGEGPDTAHLKPDVLAPTCSSSSQPSPETFLRNVTASMGEFPVSLTADSSELSSENRICSAEHAGLLSIPMMQPAMVSILDIDMVCNRGESSTSLAAASTDPIIGNGISSVTRAHFLAGLALLLGRILASADLAELSAPPSLPTPRKPPDKSASISVACLLYSCPCIIGLKPKQAASWNTIPPEYLNRNVQPHGFLASLSIFPSRFISLNRLSPVLQFRVMDCVLYRSIRLAYAVRLAESFPIGF